MKTFINRIIIFVISLFKTNIEPVPVQNNVPVTKPVIFSGNSHQRRLHRRLLGKNEV